MTDQEIELATLLSAQKGGECLSDFTKKLSPLFGPPEWTKILTEVYDRARFETVRVCLSVPPRHGKTYQTMHAIAKWTRDCPADTSAYSTYNDERARSKSRIARELARKAGVRLAPDMANLNEWRTQFGGGLLAGGVASGLTGEGVSGILVVDDPFKDRAEADSARRRQIIWEWFNSAAFTRLEGASVIVIQTRWHPDDIIGRLMKLGGWELINLPAKAEENDPLGREVGEPLDPIRFPLEQETGCLGALNAIERQIGPYEWASLYQGNPQSRGGKLFGSPTFYDPKTFDITGCRVVIGVDPAASTSTSADYSAAVVMAVRGRGAESKSYILDVVRRQLSVPDFVKVLYKMQQGYWGAVLAIESVGGFKAVPQMLKAIDRRMKILEINPRGDKFTRAQPVAAAWNQGRVLVPNAAPWMPDFLEELDSFTGVNDPHDDQVDGMAHAFNSHTYQPRKQKRGAVADPSRYM